MKRSLKTYFALFALFFVFYACSNYEYDSSIKVIPEPYFIETEENFFHLDKLNGLILQDASLQSELPFLNTSFSDLKEVNDHTKPHLLLSIDPSLNKETDSYTLSVNQKGIQIKGADKEAIFYGIQTLNQLIELNGNTDSLIYTKIEDKARFGWRGLHLDVSRHFMPKEEMKRFIEKMATHKLNVLHWHLVDGIGWRIEIDAYPELTDIGAWRVVSGETTLPPWPEFEVWREGDDRPKYGGFYTKEDIREIVQFAQKNHITIVPEIELPGHSEVVMQVFPEFACVDSTGAPQKSGVYCATNPKVFTFLETVLSEVMELFPSEYIHIGGDEVNKQHWNSCPKCKAYMEEHQIDAEDLQSEFVNHFDTWLIEHNRKLIGWHEILEGDLSQSATIMHWAGADAVKKNLEEGHPMVIASSSHLYFDHYQSLSNFEPKAFGGYSPLSKVYNYEPVPKDANKAEKDLILGVEACLWSEHFYTPEQAYYMSYPRIAALAEVTWQAPEHKNWEWFVQKMEPMMQRYKKWNINVAPSVYRPQIEFSVTDAQLVQVNLFTELPTDLYYTTDGSEPSLKNGKRFTTPFTVSHDANIKVASFKDGSLAAEKETRRAYVHKALGLDIDLQNPAYPKYASKEGATLSDADFGGDKWGNGKWLGMLDTTLVATLHFAQPTQVDSTILSIVTEEQAGIFKPRSIRIFGLNDGKETEIGSWSHQTVYEVPYPRENKHHFIHIDLKSGQYTGLKLVAEPVKIDDMGVFIFADEWLIY